MDGWGITAQINPWPPQYKYTHTHQDYLKTKIQLIKIRELQETHTEVFIREGL